MWMQSRMGFWSAVKKKPSDKHLTIRFRARKHAEEFKLNYPEVGEIISNEGTDYPYRLKVDQGVFAEIVKKEVLAVNYSNFKGFLDRAGKGSFHDLCSKVWGIFFNMEKEIKQDSITDWPK